MAIEFVVAHDATHENINKLPAGQAAGYTTGSAAIKWTDADWAAHPGAVRICQDAGATDITADVLDVERGAATLQDVVGWAKAAAESFAKVTRPGQRRPAIYTSADNVRAVVNALRSGGVYVSSLGIKLWVANWNLTEAEAILDLLTTDDGLEVIGIQYTDKAVFYDSDVFDASWLDQVSHVAPVPTVTRHVADGKESLVAVAHKAGLSVEHVVRVSADHLDSENLTALAEYLAYGDWRFFARSGAASRMPKGLVYYLP